ncbi:MAG: hypothetical protein RLZZ297_904 [Chloroflexota bacterium]
MFEITGLTSQQVKERTLRGEGNAASFRPSRSYWDIIRANLFNIFNNILFAIGVALIALGQYNDALTSVGQGLVNAIIGTVQEINAKRKLDRIALLTRSKVHVVRDGGLHNIDPAELVRGDIIRVGVGDQIVVDGTVQGEGRVDMDESLLTGEPDLVVKRAGDTVLSGSFCVSGEAYYVAERVGNDSYANQLTNSVRSFQVVKTPLQNQITFAVRLVTVIVAIMSGVILLQTVIEKFPVIRTVQISAVLSGQVPYGLFFLVALAYAAGAATIAQRGALVQQTNAVESVSNVDVLCMDKTGTLTANRLQYHDIHPLGEHDAETIKRQLGHFVHSFAAQNTTGEALARALTGEALTPDVEIPFISARKWSALSFNSGPAAGVYVLGAYEMLAPKLADDAATPVAALLTALNEWSNRGLRVLLFATSTDTSTLSTDGEPVLPVLTPVALVALSDEIRPMAKETIKAFLDMGMQLKIISGDNPHTVGALAKQVGFPTDLRVVAGPDLVGLDEADFDVAVTTNTVFGRITPQQKEQIVDSLIRQHRYVAMMGDGVNDALSLKKAKVGIAMESGSQVTRNVADMILLNDSFAALLPAFSEGKRIVAGLTISLYLFLSRVATSVLIIIMVTMIGLGFPYEPSQVALTLFTVGIPSLLLTLWAKPVLPQPNLLRRLALFVFPVALVTAICGLGIYTYFYTHILEGVSNADIPVRAMERWSEYTGLTFSTTNGTFAVAAATIVAQTALSIFVSMTAFGLILFLQPPGKWATGWVDEVSTDKRPAWMTLGLTLIFLVVLYVPASASYFGLVAPGGPELKFFAILLPVWFLVLRTIWRGRYFEKLITVDQNDA